MFNLIQSVDLTYHGHKVAFKEMMRTAELISDFNKFCHPTQSSEALTQVPESSNFSPTHCEFCSAELAVHMHKCVNTYFYLSYQSLYLHTYIYTFHVKVADVAMHQKNDCLFASIRCPYGCGNLFHRINLQVQFSRYYYYNRH